MALLKGSGDKVVFQILTNDPVVIYVYLWSSVVSLPINMSKPTIATVSLEDEVLSALQKEIPSLQKLTPILDWQEDKEGICSFPANCSEKIKKYDEYHRYYDGTTVGPCGTIKTDCLPTDMLHSFPLAKGSRAWFRSKPEVSVSCRSAIGNNPTTASYYTGNKDVLRDYTACASCTSPIGSDPCVQVLWPGQPRGTFWAHKSCVEENFAPW